MKPEIISYFLYHDALRTARVAVRYSNDTEEDRPATELEQALFARPESKVVPLSLWNEIVDFITDQVDVKDGENGEQLPNAAMSLSQQIQEAGL